MFTQDLETEKDVPAMNKMLVVSLYYVHRCIRLCFDKLIENYVQFTLFSASQVKKIMKEYVEDNNKYRHHQGVDDVPEKDVNVNSGRGGV